MTEPTRKLTLQEQFDELEARVHDADRLAEVERILQLKPDVRVQSLVQSVADTLKVPWAAVTAIDATLQHFIASSLPVVDYCERDGTKCQFVVSSRGTVAISNVERDTFWRHIVRSVVPNGKPLMAYLGVPLRVRGQTVGSLCIVDTEPREWTAHEHYVLVDTALKLALIYDEMV